MFGSKGGKPGKQEWNAFFASSVEIEGTLRFTGLLNIDGNLKGAIVAKGMLVTGSNASVEGDVFVENLILSGSVHGNIYAYGEVHLNQSAKVVGNINYHTLSIVPGAILEGNSHLFTEEERAELLEKIQAEIVSLEAPPDTKKSSKKALAPPKGETEEEKKGKEGDKDKYPSQADGKDRDPAHEPGRDRIPSHETGKDRSPSHETGKRAAAAAS
ncbi:MAG: polymer-forming cytoskeletal protein [Deltaproteobacteria bacterium]|jgi:cytoskeletal protein CcmA (bactofilin family)|nr:polymer-forming cytoskeletal protein [Deltaproteobacteria bacterium]